MPTHDSAAFIATPLGPAIKDPALFSANEIVPSLVVLANTGVGKSTFLNMLQHGKGMLKLDPDDFTFAAGGSGEAVTQEPKVYKIKTAFGGLDKPGRPLTVLDTPGLGEVSKEKD